MGLRTAVAILALGPQVSSASDSDGPPMMPGLAHAQRQRAMQPHQAASNFGHILFHCASPQISINPPELFESHTQLQPA